MRPNSATWTGSVFVHAVTTTNARCRMAASINAVAAICDSAPASTNKTKFKFIEGNTEPVTKIAMSVNNNAKGNPYKKRTCVAPRVPSCSVRLRCMALRPA